MTRADRGRSRPPTVTDVARHAGVSRQTVSNVINAPDRVKPATRQRVVRAIATLGYQTNWAARSLRVRDPRTIGCPVSATEPNAVNLGLGRFLRALTEAACAAGYLVVLFAPDAERTYDEMTGRGIIGGFVLPGATLRANRAKWLLQHEVPFVTFGRSEFGDDHPWVDVDHQAGVRDAVEHLIAAGHQRIAFVGGPPGSAVGDLGLEGYRAAMDAGGRAIRRRDVQQGKDGVELAERLFQQRRPPTAVVTVSDPLAAGCLAAAAERGLVVGSEVAVIGYDDGPLAPLLNPPLSSVRQPIERVAHEIVRILTTTLAGEDCTPAHVLLSPSLIVRASG